MVIDEEEAHPALVARIAELNNDLQKLIQSTGRELTELRLRFTQDQVEQVIQPGPGQGPDEDIVGGV